MDETVEIPKPVQEIDKPITNPREFFDKFHESNAYKDGFAKFYEGKTPSPQVTEEMKRKTFEKIEAGRIAFYLYAKETPFKYDPTQYSDETVNIINRYIEAVHKLNKARAQKISQDAIIDADSERSGLHIMLTKAMVKDGIVTTDELGKVMANAILVGEGLKQFEDTPSSQLDKIKSVVGGR